MNARRTLPVMLIITIFVTAISIMHFRPEPAGASTFTAVTSAVSHTCAITSGGGVQCWGRNGEGELGIGTTTSPYDQSGVPLPVCASGVWNGTSCSGGAALTGVYVISAGAYASHTCATVIWGILKCWGNNSAGQLGSGSDGLNPKVVVCASTSSSCNSTYHFLAGITAVATSDRHTCALDLSGNVWCWGANVVGQLGDGTTTARNVATRVCASGSGQDCPNGAPLSGVTAIAVGRSFSCALTTSGGVKCWGTNIVGELGDGTTTNRLLPVDVSGLTSGVAALVAGEFHACAVLTGGGVKCWGYNIDGELGDGTQVSKTTPVSVCATGSGASCTALTGVSKLSAGVAHTCVITTPSSVKCWGDQAFGQLGNSVQSYTTNATNPVSWTTPSWGQPQATALSAGGLHTCAIISTFVECWGWNAFGQLGNGTGLGALASTSTWIYQDVDKDGCTDAQELGPSHATGGQRDPTNFWDFFDTPDDTNTTLSAAITAGAAPPFTITVASASAFPSTGELSFFIDNEKFSYDTKTATTFHITARAVDGTTAAQHNAGALVVRNVRDRSVTIDDVGRVQARYGTSGNPTIDPLSPPPPTGYHPAFDRTYVGPNVWNLGSPDGQIGIDDITNMENQYYDSCQ
jgi:alpha-tubulin suppressor-like RCC1 family protein